jgi:hypothetical protein
MTWRRAGLRDRRLAQIWAATAALSLVIGYLARDLFSALPPCPFRVVTGIACPGCGTTRAAHAMLEGQLLDALLLNPLIFVGGMALVAAALIAPLWIVVTGRVPAFPNPVPISIRIAAVVALIANWGYLIWAGV